MNPLEQLPVPVQLLVGAATVGLMLLIGRYGMLLLETVQSLWNFAWVIGRVEDSDDSRRSFAIPPKFTDVARQLRDMDYVTFGAMRRRFPRSGHAVTLHILTLPDETATASFFQIAPPSQRVTIATWFDDDSLIVTEYPHGSRIETDRFVSRFVRGSLAAAQAYHLSRVAAWTAAGRAVRPVGDMAAYLERQAYYRAHYQPLVGHPVRNGLLLAAFPTMVAIFAGIGLLISVYEIEPWFAAGFGALFAVSVWARGRLVRDNHRRW